ncbi:hypothetical protein Pelo_8237 [Pelomyxa schiedti]|nr:hypothetical protein Pelo_8237 [Pelomyxa schiedti]
MESWACSLTEPDPWTLIPDTENPPYVLQWFTNNDNFCSEKVRSTEVWASTCITSDSTSAYVLDTGVFLVFYDYYRDPDCSGSATTFNYRKGLGNTPQCYIAFPDATWFSLSQEHFSQGYQTIEHYAGSDASASVMMIEQYYTSYCETKTVSRGSSEYDLFQNWFCTDLDNLPDPFGYWEDAILSNMYGSSSSKCSESHAWMYRLAATRDCVADQDTSKGYHIMECTSSAGAAGLLLSSGSTDSTCETEGTTQNIVQPGTATEQEWCYTTGSNNMGFFDLHCELPNPAFQVRKSFTDVAMQHLLSVDVYWSQYCTTVAPSSDFVINNTCLTSLTTFSLGIDYPISVSRYLDSNCSKPANSWSFYSPECHNYDFTSYSCYYVDCNVDDSDAHVNAYECEERESYYYDCTGECSTKEILESGSASKEGCFTDQTGKYMTVQCAPPNPAWQSIYTFPGPSVFGDDTSKMTEMRYYWSENCVEYVIPGTYYTENVVHSAVCTTSEPALCSLWPDAFVAQVQGAVDVWDSTWAYNSHCISHQTGTASYGHSCFSDEVSFEGSISELSYSTSACSGSSTSKLLTPEGIHTDSYTTLYYCQTQNRKWQVLKQHLYQEDDPIYRVVVYVNPYCCEYSTVVDGYFTEAECRDIGTDDPVSTDYFTTDPVEILWYSGSSCSTVNFTNWYSLDCLSPYENSAFISYCNMERSTVQMAQFDLPTCPPSLHDVQTLTYVVSPSGTASQCNLFPYTRDDPYITRYYQLTTCGAFDDLEKFNMDILVDGSDCAREPLYASGTVTRFCDYSAEGTCDLFGDTGTYINQTCLDGTSISKTETSLVGGAVLLYSPNDRCGYEDITDVYFYKGGDCVCTTTECWGLECTNSESSPGTVTFTMYHGLECDINNADVEEHPEGVCDTGQLWLCPASQSFPTVWLSLSSCVFLIVFMGKVLP